MKENHPHLMFPYSHGFHVQDGLHFKRLENGSVKLTKMKTALAAEIEILYETVIDEGAWLQSLPAYLLMVKTVKHGSKLEIFTTKNNPESYRI